MTTEELEDRMAITLIRAGIDDTTRPPHANKLLIDALVAVAAEHAEDAVAAHQRQAASR